MKRIYKLLLVLVAIFAFNFNVLAEGEMNCLGEAGTNCGSAEDIAPLISPNEENITDQAFYLDEDLNVTKDIDASAFMVGNTIKSTGTIYGSHFVAGNEINISGTTDYSFYAGQTLKIHDFHSNDVFIAGKDLEFNNVLGRTYYIAGQNITISDSTIDKLYLAGEKVVLNGEFENVTIAAEKVIVNGSITGVLEINESAKLETMGDTTIETINKYKDFEKDSKFSKGNTFAALLFVIVVAFIKGYVNLALIGVIIIAYFKGMVKKLNKEDIDASFVFSRIGIGLCTLIVVPVVSIIALFTGVATLLGVILLLAYIIGIIISTPIVTIYLSDKLLKSIKNDYLRYLVGLLILQLIKKVPVIGGLVTFLSLLLGLGLIIQLLKKEKKEK